MVCMMRSSGQDMSSEEDSDETSDLSTADADECDTDLRHERSSAAQELGEANPGKGVYGSCK